VYVQIIDKQGEVHLEAEGQPICPDPVYTDSKKQENLSACTDDDHGAIAVWEDYRDSNPATQIYAQRVGNNGELHWGNIGIRVSPYDRQQNNPQVVTDGAGGGIVAWSELSPFYDNKVSAARIDHSGNTIWSIEVGDNAWQDDLFESMAPDGSGGAYIAYKNLDPLEPNNYNLYAQHVDESGALLWETSGVVVCEAENGQLNCSTIGLGSDGVIFLWEDSRNGFDKDVYAQRFSFDGDTLWTINGVAVIAEAEDQAAPDAALDIYGNLIVTWEDYRNAAHMDIYIQKLDIDGQLLFQTSGIEVSTAALYQNSAKVLSDGQGGSYIVWVDFRTGTFPDLYGTHLDENGQLSTETVQGWNEQWVEDGNIICDEFHWQHNQELIDDYEDGVIVVWEDKRSSGKEELINLYAQRLNGSVVSVEPSEDGELPSSFKLHHPYPNPFNPEVKITFDIAKPGLVKLSVYDIQGRLIETLQEGWISAGSKEIFWRAKGLASGAYIVSLEKEGEKSLKKIILLK